APRVSSIVAAMILLMRTPPSLESELHSCGMDCASATNAGKHDRVRTVSESDTREVTTLSTAVRVDSRSNRDDDPTASSRGRSDVHELQPAADRSRRDTVYFSILDDEWPAVKARLEARLSGRL